MVNTREVTEDGLEKNFATNTLGKKISYYSFYKSLFFVNGYLLSYTCSNGFAKVILIKLRHTGTQFQHSYVYLAWQNITETAFKVNISRANHECTLKTAVFFLIRNPCPDY